MPIIYLSPSTQEHNFYVTGGTEEYHMNLLADRLVPYLDASGIRYVRNTPQMTAVSSIAASNRGSYDLHLALHSNASGSGYGTARGSIAFYYPSSAKGRRAGTLFAENLREIYPLPDKVSAQPSTTIGEVRLVKAPAVLLEVAFHDNVDDADWITDNTDEIAKSIARSLAEYFGIPFLTPAPARSGLVQVSSGNLNIRERPSTDAKILARAPKGAPLAIINQWNDWYLINYNGIIGYASSDYITVT